jgi:hypothetical protein
MGRMSFRQELKALAKASEGMDAGGTWPPADGLPMRAMLAVQTSPLAAWFPRRWRRHGV